MYLFVDIDKEYVIAALGPKTAVGECVDITTETSLNLSKSSPLFWLDQDWRYLRLKPCMKIKSGTGDPDNPYILESECK